MNVVKKELMEFSQQLKSIMESRGFTYASLSRASGVGKSLIFNWANGTQPKSVKNLIALSDALGVSIDELCTGKPPETNAIHYI